MLFRTATLSIAFTTCRLLAARIEGAEGPPRTSSDSAELSGERPGSFSVASLSLPGSVQGRGQAACLQAGIALVCGLVGSRGPLEGKAAEKQDDRQHQAATINRR